MANSKYTIKYSQTYINQFNHILKYFVNTLKNKIAADDFYNEVIKEIEKRSKNPESYEKYVSIKKKKSTYYRIYIRNYTIFYTVKNNIMEVRRILYSKRNFNNLVQQKFVFTSISPSYFIWGIKKMRLLIN